MRKVELIKKICPICENNFEVPKYLNNIKTCSITCGRKSQGLKMKGNTFGFKKGYIPWSKGLTKETDDRLKNISKKTTQQMHREYKIGIRDRFTITKKANEFVRKYGQPKLKGKPTHMLGKTKKNGLYKESWGFQKGKDNIINKYTEKHPNYILEQKGHKTAPEKVIEQLLKEKGIKHIFNKRIGTYWVDFLLTEKNLILEVDGNYWHQKDNPKRDNYLKSKGYDIMHWKVTKYSKFKLENSAKEFIKNIK